MYKKDFYKEAYKKTLYTITKHMPYEKVSITSKDYYSYFNILESNIQITVFVGTKGLSVKLPDKNNEYIENTYYTFKDFDNHEKIISRWNSFLNSILLDLDSNKESGEDDSKYPTTYKGFK